jgi:hypothetical protein
MTTRINETHRVEFDVENYMRFREHYSSILNITVENISRDRLLIEAWRSKEPIDEFLVPSPKLSCPSPLREGEILVYPTVSKLKAKWLLCSMIKNEDLYIVEWVSYHLLVLLPVICSFPLCLVLLD